MFKVDFRKASLDSKSQELMRYIAKREDISKTTLSYHSCYSSLQTLLDNEMVYSWHPGPGWPTMIQANTNHKAIEYTP